MCPFALCLLGKGMEHDTTPTTGPRRGTDPRGADPRGADHRDADRTDALLLRARGLVAKLAPQLVEKTIWSSPAGKKRLAKRLVALLPDRHTTYVEPFAGSAAVLFEKPPVQTEAINDFDPEIADAYKILKRVCAADVARLRKMDWTGKRETWRALKEAEPPKDDIARLHRFLYLTHFSYGRLRGKSYNVGADGKTASTPDRVEEFAPRIKKVHVYSGDYERVVRKYDSRSTVHYLDPPYPGYNVAVGESDFDEPRFLKMLKDLKGQFLVTYGIRGELPKQFAKEGFQVKRIHPPRTIRAMRGVGGPRVLTTLLVSNYGLVEKRLDELGDDGWEIDSEIEQPPEERSSEERSAGEAAPDAEVFTKSIPLIKGIEPSDERYVMGIVLEPDVVDAQGDTYSAEEIRGAAHKFMEDFGGLGLMHRMRVNGQVKVLESYLAPTSFKVGEREVRKGTWLLAVRILADELWERVRDGDLTGFSIGGSARRIPEAAPAGAAARAAAEGSP
jgi:DNA adenine methylase